MQVLEWNPFWYIICFHLLFDSESNFNCIILMVLRQVLQVSMFEKTEKQIIYPVLFFVVVFKAKNNDRKTRNMYTMHSQIKTHIHTHILTHIHSHTHTHAHTHARTHTSNDSWLTFIEKLTETDWHEWLRLHVKQIKNNSDKHCFGPHKNCTIAGSFKN